MAAFQWKPSEGEKTESHPTMCDVFTLDVTESVSHGDNLLIWISTPSGREVFMRSVHTELFRRLWSRTLTWCSRVCTCGASGHWRFRWDTSCTHLHRHTRRSCVFLSPVDWPRATCAVYSPSSEGSWPLLQAVTQKLQRALPQTRPSLQPHTVSLVGVHSFKRTWAPKHGVMPLNHLKSFFLHANVSKWACKRL